MIGVVDLPPTPVAVLAFDREETICPNGAQSRPSRDAGTSQSLIRIAIVVKLSARWCRLELTFNRQGITSVPSHRFHTRVTARVSIPRIREEETEKV